jgi:hypothetical protein
MNARSSAPVLALGCWLAGCSSDVLPRPDAEAPNGALPSDGRTATTADAALTPDGPAGNPPFGTPGPGPIVTVPDASSPGADAPGPLDVRPPDAAPNFPPIPPPISPPPPLPPLPPPSAACPSPTECAALMTEYDRALIDAQRCTIGDNAACGMKAPRTLKCPSCEVWVSDRTPLDPLLLAFKNAGCEGCSFRGLAPDGTCPTGPCSGALTAPFCSGVPGLAFPGVAPAAAGQCGNAEATSCGVGVMTGAPCAANDACFGGGHRVCTCFRPNTTWQCL